MRFFSCPPGEGNPWLELSKAALKRDAWEDSPLLLLLPSKSSNYCAGGRAVKRETQMGELLGGVWAGGRSCFFPQWHSLVQTGSRKREMGEKKKTELKIKQSFF